MTGGSTTSPRTSEPPRADRRLARVVTALRFGFAALLLVAGVAKLIDFPGFVAVVETYRFLPDVLLAYAAVALTVAELVIGGCLLVGYRLLEAALATVLLHLGYFAWLAIAFARATITAVTWRQAVIRLKGHKV